MDAPQSPVPQEPPIDGTAIAAAARALEAGELVAFPTETVYGLGADAENPQAVARIYAAKGRPSNHPVIVHLAPEADPGYWAASVPDEARRLIDAFWPGPLTLILPRAARIPDAVSGGQDSIGLRCPSHPVAQALLRAFRSGRGGVAAPSANRFGRVSPTTAQHVRDEFGAGPGSPVGHVLDGGPSAVGIESTIVDLSGLPARRPALLRPGHVGTDALAAVLGEPLAAPDAGAPRASGTLDAHYAPATPVALVAAADLARLARRLRDAGRRAALIHYTALPADMANMTGATSRRMLPGDPAGYAHHLYAALREMDAVAADIILVERPPADARWQGVNDRLRRAAHDSRGALDTIF